MYCITQQCFTKGGKYLPTARWSAGYRCTTIWDSLEVCSIHCVMVTIAPLCRHLPSSSGPCVGCRSSLVSKTDPQSAVHLISLTTFVRARLPLTERRKISI